MGVHTWVYVGGSLDAVGSRSNERSERPVIDANDIPLNACARVWVCGCVGLTWFKRSHLRIVTAGRPIITTINSPNHMYMHAYLSHGDKPLHTSNMQRGSARVF